MPRADYNVAPTTHNPSSGRAGIGRRELVLARWGLVPFFTKDLNDVKGLSTINARAETITKAPTWREPFKKRRQDAQDAQETWMRCPRSKRHYRWQLYRNYIAG